jgi:competence protein ComFC
LAVNPKPRNPSGPLQPLIIDRILWSTVDWLFPPECASCQRANFVFCPSCEDQAVLITGPVCNVCGTPTPLPKTICIKCLTNPPLFSGMRSWALYETSVREAIHSLKYKNNIPLAFYFSKKLIPIIQKENWELDTVVPVPLYKSHFKERGFNQSALISRPIAHFFGTTLSLNGLQRIRETSPQFSLSSKERYANVKDAFSGNAATLNEKTVLLVDDIITTGATIENCTKALLAAGAKKVYCLSVARVFVDQ